MIRQFAPLNASSNILKHFYCETQEQAGNKAQFAWPDTFMFVQVKPTGRKFKNMDEFITFMDNKKNQIILS